MPVEIKRPNFIPRGRSWRLLYSAATKNIKRLEERDCACATMDDVYAGTKAECLEFITSEGLVPYPGETLAQVTFEFGKSNVPPKPATPVHGEVDFENIV